MVRMLAPWVVALAALVGADGSSAEDAGDGVLTGKGLRANGSMFVLRGEDEVKKASDVAEARLKEYRRAATWEKMSARDEAGRKALAAELTKQRAVMKQQLARNLPDIDAQVRNLSQQQAAMRQQINGLQYGTSLVTAMAHNQLVDQHNALSDQIEALQLQRNRMVAAYNDLGEQVSLLDPRPGSAESKGAEKPPAASPLEKRQAYVEALAALRKLVDETRKSYETLAEDDEVKAALKSRNARSDKIKYALGPTRKFLDTAKALELAEAKVASDTILEEPKTPATQQRKSRAIRGR